VAAQAVRLITEKQCLSTYVWRDITGGHHFCPRALSQSRYFTRIPNTNTKRGSRNSTIRPGGTNSTSNFQTVSCVRLARFPPWSGDCGEIHSVVHRCART
jgi:hypothetical protein